MEWPSLCTTRLIDQNFGQCFSPEDVLFPFNNCQGTNYYRPWKLMTESPKDFCSAVENTKQNFKVILDVQHFQPNEVKVSVIDKEIIIEGKHEERKDDHGLISRHFVRKYTLPCDCPPETVTSTLSSDGVLTVMANKIPNKEIGNEKIVSIQRCGPAKNGKCKTKEQTKEDIKEESIKKSELDKKRAQISEEHCRLVKPEFMKATVSASEALSSSETFSSETKESLDLRDKASVTEQILSESRKETDELLKLMSSNKSASIAASVTSDKIEEALGSCKTAIAELKDRVNESSMSSSETSSFKSSMITESVETIEALSTSQSSMSMKATSGKISDLMSEALKETAENM